MKRISIITSLLIFFLTLSASACENDREINGYFWTFHQMDDGNSYHQCRLNKSYSSGSSLILTAPCQSRFIDAAQTEWTDDHRKMKCELITFPGEHKLGRKDIGTNSRATWKIGKKVKSLEFKFDGNRNDACRINWIRVFYGKSSSHNDQQMIKNDIQSITTPDRIKFKKGPIERNCRVMAWNGSELTIIVDRGGSRNVKRHLKTELIDYILFSHRWGTATGPNGLSVPFKAKRLKDNLLWFEKKEGDRVISKDQYPIDKFKKIEFNN